MARTGAYWCFTILSLIGLVGLLLEVIPMDFGSSQALGMLLGIPLFLVGCVCILIGISVTIFKARERPLLMMSACVILIILVSAIGSTLSEEQKRWGEPLSVTVAILLWLLMSYLSIRWFTTERARKIS